jgi:hypothetical protein
VSGLFLIDVKDLDEVIGIAALVKGARIWARSREQVARSFSKRFVFTVLRFAIFVRSSVYTV